MVGFTGPSNTKCFIFGGKIKQIWHVGHSVQIEKMSQIQPQTRTASNRTHHSLSHSCLGLHRTSPVTSGAHNTSMVAPFVYAVVCPVWSSNSQDPAICGASGHFLSVHFFRFLTGTFDGSPRATRRRRGYSETLAGGQPGLSRAAPPAAFDMAARSSGSCGGCGSSGQPQRLDVMDDAGNPGACRVTCMQTACVLSCIVSCIVLCKLLCNVSSTVQRGAPNGRARVARQRRRGGPGRQGGGQGRWGECAVQHACKLLA